MGASPSRPHYSTDLIGGLRHPAPSGLTEQVREIKKLVHDHHCPVQVQFIPKHTFLNRILYNCMIWYFAFANTIHSPHITHLL